MTVSELEERISSREYIHWQALYEVEANERERAAEKK